jgi:uncharacterized membrane protein YeaQ/YmgE (transglycosylase-associated protein family)
LATAVPLRDSSPVTAQGPCRFRAVREAIHLSSVQYGCNQATLTASAHYRADLVYQRKEIDMGGMGWIAWIIIGIIAGWLAEQIMGRNHGLLTNLIVGVIGALIGGFVANALGFAWGGWIGSTIVATIGAIILLFILGLVKRR